MTDVSKVFRVDQLAQSGTAPLKETGVEKMSPRSVAVDFLLGRLRNGPLAVTELDRRARSRGLVGKEFIGQNKAFRTARKLLGIIAFQQARKWHWRLPQVPSCSTPDDPTGIPATSADRSIATPEPASAAEGVAVHADTSVRRDPVDPTEAAVTRWAEGIAKLDYSRPPHGVSALRWQTFISDAGTFMASIWPARAAILGWTAADLFGFDKANPVERRDRLGLCWCCLGGQVIALHRDGATFSSRGTERYHARRRIDPRALRLPWR